MSDVAIAIWVACGLMTVFGAALLSRRPVSRPAPLPASVPAPDVPRGQLDSAGARLEAVEERQKATDHHIANIRTMMQALPSKDAVHRLEVELAALKGDVKLGNAEGLATARAVERIEHILMSSSRPQP